MARGQPNKYSPDELRAKCTEYLDARPDYPSIIALCTHLGISRAIWYRWKAREDLAPIVAEISDAIAALQRSLDAGTAPGTAPETAEGHIPPQNEPAAAHESPASPTATDTADDKAGFVAFWNAWPNELTVLEAQSAWQGLTPDDRQDAMSRAPSWCAAWNAAYPDGPMLAVNYLLGNRWNDRVGPAYPPDVSLKVIQWIKPSGLQIQTNDCLGNVEYAETLGWMRQPEG